jgi:hypothetical protein
MALGRREVTRVPTATSATRTSFAAVHESASGISGASLRCSETALLKDHRTACGICLPRLPRGTYSNFDARSPRCRIGVQRVRPCRVVHVGEHGPPQCLGASQRGIELATPVDSGECDPVPRPTGLPWDGASVIAGGGILAAALRRLHQLSDRFRQLSRDELAGRPFKTLDHR